MALILTFLGKGESARTQIAIASAKKFAQQGKRVLIIGNGELGLSSVLNTTLTTEPQEVSPNLQAVQLQTAVLLEKIWDDIKKLEAQYLKTPFLKDVYGQELAVVPGMDGALALNAIRQYEESGKYDVIVFDGTGDTSMLRMFGLPESLSWYVRRFRQVIVGSELGKNIAESPLIQPLISTFFNVNWTADNFAQPTNLLNEFLDRGKNAIADPRHTAAFLVTGTTPNEITIAKYLWGSAQQVGLTVGGAIVMGEVADSLKDEFSPIPVTSIPNGNQEPDSIIDKLPDFVAQAIAAPRPTEIDLSHKQVKVFLPGFDKKQVKLTQYGPEVTIEAGDQRRNIFLPPPLNGKPVTGAKFNNQYLLISF